MLVNLLPNEWQKVLLNEKTNSILEDVENFLSNELANNKTFFPATENIFKSFELCSFERLKVVIIGQDPYHDDNQACGLAFAVPTSQKKIPPSLKNIYKELASDLNLPIPNHGNLESWATQGVLLLNSTLTVEPHKANSHKNSNWENFTNEVISQISLAKEHVVFILWGNHAIQKSQFIDTDKHTIIKEVHPSPLSANRGFFGSKPFSKCNNALQKYKLSQINWEIKPIYEGELF